MPLLAYLARIFLLRRLLGGGRRRRGRSHPGARYGVPYGRRQRARGGGGFGMRGPFPTYSRRTRGGGTVSVTGCCLPIPLTFALGAGLAGRAARRRR